MAQGADKGMVRDASGSWCWESLHFGWNPVHEKPPLTVIGSSECGSKNEEVKGWFFMHRVKNNSSIGWKDSR